MMALPPEAVAVADDNDRPATELIDYVAVVIGPLLIMLMVGSLVFFLVDVLYSGQYPERLLHTMFFFVVGAVLVARIGIQFGTGRAMLYVLALGFATFLAMQAYVTYPTAATRAMGPVISLGLMALIWWAANKLTWDCTHLDGEREAGGRGLLAATGLAGAAEEPEPEPEDEPTGKKKKKKEPSPGIVGWVERWNAYREVQKKKPHTPGTWVVYFGLAAVPLFILGQSLIPADDSRRRFWTLLEMAAFVGSGLGLLVTTSLLGLKKYLQDRGARIPGAMTASWLGLGAVIIVSFLAIGALLPRPHSETPLVSLPKGAKSERKASKVAPMKGNEAGKGEGAQGRKTEAGDGKSNAKGGKEGGKGEKGDAKSGSGSKDGQPKSGGGDQKGDKGGGKQGNDKSNDGGKQKGNDGGKNDQSKQGDQKGDKGDQQKDAEQKDGNDAKDTDEGNDAQDGNAEGQSESQIAKAFESIGAGVKWLVWIVVAILVVAGVILFLLKGLAPFTSWARGLLDWFRGLFGRKKKAGTTKEDEEEEDEGERLPPFDSFSNPFRDGSAGSRPLPDLVGYTFAALESWAADREAERKPGETSREFADRLINEYPKLETGGKLSALVNRVAYSKRPLPEDAAETLKRSWREMETS